MRIPMVLISPYAIPHNISKTDYSYGSILRLEETLISVRLRPRFVGQLAFRQLQREAAAERVQSRSRPAGIQCANAAMPNGMMQRIIEHDGGVPE